MSGEKMPGKKIGNLFAQTTPHLHTSLQFNPISVLATTTKPPAETDQFPEDSGEVP